MGPSPPAFPVDCETTETVVQIQKKKRSESQLSTSWRKQGVPEQGNSPQATLSSSPSASSVQLGLQRPFKFEIQRREPRACVRGGACLSPPRRSVVRPRPAGRCPWVALLAVLGGGDEAGGAVLPALQPPRGPECHTPNVRAPHPVKPIPRTCCGWAFRLPLLLSAGLRALVFEIPLALWLSVAFSPPALTSP